jgi:hypothetical protein
MQAQALASALNALAKKPQFDHTKARATARKDPGVDWARTKAAGADFNPEVDGCPDFVMLDGSTCVWNNGRGAYTARPA